MLRNPCILGGPHLGGQNQKWLPYPCLLEAEKRAELLRKPCNLRGPQER